MCVLLQLAFFGIRAKKQDEEEADEWLHAVIRLIEIGSLWIVAFRTVLAHSLAPSLRRWEEWQ